MKKRLRAIAYGLRRAIGGATGRPMVSLLATGAIGVALLLFGLVALTSDNVARMTDRWGRGVQMVVYLSEETTPERARAIGGVLASASAVEGVDYVSAAEAHRRLAESLGDGRDLLEGVEVGYLPASLEVTLAAGVRDMAQVSPLVDKLRQVPGVEEVEFLGDWVDRVTALLASLRIAALALALIVGAACIYVVASTIKLGVYARKDELEILKLVGATDGFVKAPLLVEGALQGTLGAAAGIGLLYGFYQLGAPVLEKLLGGVLGAPLSFLPAGILGAFLVAGALLGLLGSWIAIGRYAEV